MLMLKASATFLTRLSKISVLYPRNVDNIDPAPRAGGVVTIIHDSLPRTGPPFELTEHTRPGEYLVVGVPFGETTLFVHNIYAPTGESLRRRFFAELPREFGPHALHMVCGDFNNVLDDVLDCVKPRSRSETPTSYLLDWMSSLHLVDAWRRHHPFERVYSSPPRARRIDFILLSQVLSDAAYRSSNYVEYYGLGDHLAHRRGSWSIPTRLQLYVKKLLDTLPDLRNSDNPGILWQIWKNKLRAKLIQLGRNFRKSQTQPLATQLSSLRRARDAAADPVASDQDERARDEAQAVFDEVANGDVTTVTGAYFADDSALFPRDQDALAEQLVLVDAYCRGSGARLNRAKSQLLTLNRNAEVVINGLGAVTTSTVYLGITIGPAVMLPAIEQALEKKAQGSTEPLAIQSTNTVWQAASRQQRCSIRVMALHAALRLSTNHPRSVARMVANYVLYSTPPDTKRSLHLISRELHALPKTDGGVQIPQISSTIRHQRFKMLQDLIRVGTSSPEKLTLVAGRLFALVLGPVYTADGFEWLWTSPSDWPKRTIKLLPTRWVSSWMAWSKVDWPSDTPDPGPWTTSITAANSSLWLALRSPLDQAARSLYLLVPPSLQPLCQALAAAGFQSATPFFTGEGTWPEYQPFFALVNRSVRITGPNRQVFKLYTLVTRTVHSCLPGPIPTPTSLPPALRIPRRGLRVRDQWVPFPHIPKLHCVRLVTATRPNLRKPHPLEDHGLPTGISIHEHTRRIRELRAAVTPAIHDVYVRLTLKLLPTGSRLWQRNPPDDTQRICSHGTCHSIETEQHIFFDCNPVRALWDQ